MFDFASSCGPFYSGGCQTIKINVKCMQVAGLSAMRRLRVMFLDRDHFGLCGPPVEDCFFFTGLSNCHHSVYRTVAEYVILRSTFDRIFVKICVMASVSTSCMVKVFGTHEHLIFPVNV